MSEGEYTVWCLLGKKAGDNTQVRALADALGDQLGCGYEEKRIVARPWELLSHLTLRVTLAGIDRAASSELAPPWPDLVISAGRRNEPVARWIRAQSQGKTRLVHIGRPWAPLDSWDLIVTTPQYFLPEQTNILHNSLPLHRVTEAGAEQAARQWRERFGQLPRPRIAVLMGGDSGRFVMTPAKGARLGGLANNLAQATGGALLISDSPRTPKTAGDALQGAIRAPNFCFRFAGGGENPYTGLLALADAFIVTGESMSMLAEAADTGKPLFIFDPGDGATPWWKLPHAWRYKPLSHRLAMRFGPLRMRRDIGRIQGALVDSGRAVWLDEAGIAAATAQLTALEGAPQASSVAEAELERSAQAVRRLLTPR